MVIIGFEDYLGNPVIKTEEEKKKFLEMSHMKKEDVIFADGDTSIPKTMKAIAGAKLALGKKCEYCGCYDGIHRSDCLFILKLK